MLAPSNDRQAQIELRSCSTADEARSRVGRIRAHVEDIKTEIIAAWEGRDWLALGYQSWDEYCTTEFGAAIAIPKSEQAELVFHLRDHGMSLRAIESATGISKSTVARQAPTVPSGTVTGVNGKTYRPTSVSDEPLTSQIDDLFDGIRQSLGIPDDEWAQLLRVGREEGGQMPDGGARDLEPAEPSAHDAPSTPAYEYRVRWTWNRDKNPTYKTFKTLAGARKWSDEKATHFHLLHDLAIERREVSPWQPLPAKGDCSGADR